LLELINQHALVSVYSFNTDYVKLVN